MVKKHPILIPIVLLLAAGPGALRGQKIPAPVRAEADGTGWPQWRGPDRSGTWYGGPHIDTLTPAHVHPQWEVPVGPGYSGPTVSSGRVYLMDYSGGMETIRCFHAKTGKQIWVHSYPVTYSVGYPTGPRASVQVSGGNAYAWGTMGHLHCLDAGSGRLIWSVNTVDSYGSRLPIWGMASNPLLVDDKVVVQVGGLNGAGVVAFHRDNGTEQWRALDEEASYVAPVLIEQAGRRVVVVWTGESISALDPDTGAVHWRIPFEPAKMIMNVADPVYDPPYLFLSAFFDGSYLLKLHRDELAAELVYHRKGENERETDALHCCISTPLVEDGYVYGIDSYGEARCLELTTGDRVWEDPTLVPKARWANVHLIRQGNRIWGFNELGELLLGELSPGGYRSLGRAKVIDPVRISPNPRNGVTWAHPAFSGDRIYIRNDEKLVCLRINNH